MWLLRFLKSNVLYIIWFLLYFAFAWIILGQDWRSFYIASAVYGVSITLALSPIGEVVLRLLENCRKPATAKEKEYLIPLFEEVYQDAKEFNPSLNNGIKIYIMDAMYVNAFAIGRKTIAVTKGALETFNREELKGILAHELGHMTHGHTKALLLTLVGNLFFSLIIWVLRFILSFVEFLADVTASYNVIGYLFLFIGFLVRIIFEAFVFLFVNLGQLLLAINSRTNELIADKFAFQIEYGKQLIDALYLIQKISINRKLKLSEQLRASHPHTAFRIEALEKLEDKATAVLV